jgi:hypothetical protein
MKIRIDSPPESKTKGITFGLSGPNSPRNYDTDKYLPGIKFTHDTTENLLGTLKDLAFHNGMDKKQSQMIQYSSGNIKEETFFADFLSLDNRNTEIPSQAPMKIPEKYSHGLKPPMDSPSLPDRSRRNSQIINLKDYSKHEDETSSFQDKPEDPFYSPKALINTSKKPERTNIYHQIDCFRSQIQKIISKLGRDLKNKFILITEKRSPSLGVPIVAV